jgi:hypothetical protein
MADDKRNRPDQQQGDNQPNRQRDKERRPGGGNIESPDNSQRPRKDDESEPQR